MTNLLAIPTFFTIGNFNVALLDIVLLVFALIAIIVGAVKGFSAQILSLLGWVAGVALAVIFCDDISALIYEKLPAVPEAIYNWLNGVLGLEEIITGEQTVEAIVAYLAENTQIPAFLHQAIAQAVVDGAGTLQITDVVTGWAVTAISALSIFIVALIVFGIIKAIFKAINKVKVIGFVDKLLGAVFNVLKLLIVSILLTLLFSSVFPEFFTSILHPVLESGEEVVCYFNEIMHWVMELPVVQDALTSLFAGGAV